MPQHRLHREIITTVVVNDFVDQSGITCFHRLSGETGAGASEVVRAQIAARTIFSAEPLDAAIRALDHRIDASVQTKLRLEVRTLVERATRWLVNNRRRPVDIGAAVDELAAGVRRVQDELPDHARASGQGGVRVRGWRAMSAPTYPRSSRWPSRCCRPRTPR